MSEYTPLEEYGAIGNLETTALVGADGAIDWCCLPTVSSPGVFARLLDPGGGHFSIRPTGEYESEQAYLDETAVLQTTFETDSGTVTVTDFMPFVGESDPSNPKVQGIYRRVACTEGEVELDVVFEPRFDFVRADTHVESTDNGAVASGDETRLFLVSPTDLDVNEAGTNATATVDLSADEDRWYVLQYGMEVPTDDDRCESLLEQTASYWQGWTHDCGGDCPLEGYAHDLVTRSAIVLKLLTFRDTGAIAAAPTASLPEVIGGVRNWDYRYSWIRDGAFTTRALVNLGHERETREYIEDFLQVSRERDPEEIRPLYSLDHGDLEEETLDYFEGYRGSTPVRIGNQASGQTQLDVYGELILAVYHLAEARHELDDDDWEAIKGIVDHVCEAWDRTDAGIWELRDNQRHFVHSKVMCWIALDRALEIAADEEFDAPVERWSEARDEIKQAVIEKGYDEERGSFTQSFRNEQLDASVLMLPLSGMLPFDDERVQSTIDTVWSELGRGDGLVCRYEEDPLPGEEGAFVACSYWLVSCLALSDRLEEAWEVFEAANDHVSPLGLLSEEVDPDSGDLLGNFPQGFSHLGVINAALYLKAAEEGEEMEDPLGIQSFGDSDAGRGSISKS
ncbi:glycoside hydrolase 15-like protein [Halogeometricum pallidum JCM 14848]|uniref:Glycoside hydrolase 15-like protein n=1 Tax=Halogeometricum pallidum JCM 14848 TaxID=1227487 RepID=M0CTE5_HALPD|nr:glycoside hydrolase family 15 protein [Halogeometricum pallidum]ELZ26481.1 glycoside hydrolase 15-like protein [Halogeometricum pallidum JCM 14848]